MELRTELYTFNVKFHILLCYAKNCEIKLNVFLIGKSFLQVNQQQLLTVTQKPNSKMARIIFCSLAEESLAFCALKIRHALDNFINIKFNIFMNLFNLFIDFYLTDSVIVLPT